MSDAPRTIATLQSLKSMLEPMRGGSRVTDAEMKIVEGVIESLAQCSLALETDLTSAQTELATLRERLAERDEAIGQCRAVYLEAIERAQQAEKDAERYRWLRSGPSVTEGKFPSEPWTVRVRAEPWPTLGPCEGNELDAAIDAPRSAK